MAKISDENDSVFRVSLPGEDVYSTSPGDFAEHSGFDYPKIEEDLVGIVDYTVPDSLSVQDYTIATVTHNLGYSPCAFCFVQDIDSVGPTQFASLPFPDSVLGENYFFAYTTSTQFIIKMRVGNTTSIWTGADFKFKYQIWVND